jgi:hypothetical protein
MAHLKQGLVIALMLAITAGMAVNYWAHNSPKCTSDIVDSQAALLKSDSNLLAAANGSSDSKCKAYRHHLEVLDSVTRITSICGPSQMSIRSAWSHPEAEAAFYRRLVANECS